MTINIIRKMWMCEIDLWVELFLSKLNINSNFNLHCEPRYFSDDLVLHSVCVKFHWLIRQPWQMNQHACEEISMRRNNDSFRIIQYQWYVTIFKLEIDISNLNQGQKVHRDAFVNYLLEREIVANHAFSSLFTQHY